MRHPHSIGALPIAANNRLSGMLLNNMRSTSRDHKGDDNAWFLFRRGELRSLPISVPSIARNYFHRWQNMCHSLQIYYKWHCKFITYYKIWNAQSHVPYFIRGKKILFQIFQTVFVQFPFDVTYKRHYPQFVGRQLRRSVCFSRPLFIHLFIYESNCNFFYSSMMIRMFNDLSALCRK